jgi:transcription initiation factor IIE alpha subunit
MIIFNCLLIGPSTKISKIMSRFDRENLKIRILKLVDLKSTGSPEDLAYRLGISKRSVKRLVSEIREDGQRIKYCQIIESYVNENEYY